MSKMLTFVSNHPQLGTFDVFTVGSPKAEIQAIFLYLLVPIVIGSLVVRILFFIRADRFKIFPKEASLWPASMMWATAALTPISAPFYFLSLIIYGSPYSAKIILFDLFYASFLSLPLTLLLLLCVLYTMSLARGRPILTNVAAYVASVACLIADYFWLSEVTKN